MNQKANFLIKEVFIIIFIGTAVAHSSLKSFENDLFGNFLGCEDLMKYIQIHPIHRNKFITYFNKQNIILNDALSLVSWNSKTKSVKQFWLNKRENEAEAEELVIDVFSRIPETESPNNYEFALGGLSRPTDWFMIAFHRRTHEIIGRQNIYVKKAKHHVLGDYEPCEPKKKWIKKAGNVPGSFLDDVSRVLLKYGFHFSRGPDNTKPNSYERDFQCALDHELEKSVNFLLSQSENPWMYVLDSTFQVRSRDMMRIIFRHVSTFTRDEQLKILLHTDVRGQLVFFEITMSIVWGNEQPEELLIFSEDVRKEVYTSLLFLGVVQEDFKKCKLAVENGAPLQKKLKLNVAHALAYRWCKNNNPFDGVVACTHRLSRKFSRITSVGLARLLDHSNPEIEEYLQTKFNEEYQKTPKRKRKNEEDCTYPRK